MSVRKRYVIWLAVLALGLSLGVVPAATASTTSEIYGTVLGINNDPSGVNTWNGPLPAVRVAVFEASTGSFLKGTDTDASGRYRIGGLPGTTVKVRFTKPSWLTTWRAGLTLGPGASINLAAHTMYAEAVVTIAVGDETDVVNAPIRLTIYDAETGAVIAAKSSDSNEVTIRRLPARPVRFRVTAPDYITAWAGPFTLVAGEHWVKPADWPYDYWWLNMHHADDIYGTVVDADGPLPGVKVLVIDAAGNGLSRVYTDADGTYRARMLAPGQTVTVQFSKDGYQTVKHPAPIDLQWEEIYGRQYDLGTTTLTMDAATATVSGAVLSEMDPLSYVTVTVYDASTGAVIANVFTGPADSFRISGLPPVPIALRATKPGYLTRWFGGGSSLDTAHVYQLIAGQELKLPWYSVDIPPEAIVTVHVGDETDVVNAPIRLTIYDAVTGDVIAAKSSDSNEVTIRQLPARPVRFRVTAPDYITAWAGPFDLYAGSHWVKPADWPYDYWWLNMHHADDIYGTVVDADGPLPGVKVLVIDAAGNGLSRVYTDADGTYRARMLAPGQTVTVQFSKDGYQTVKHPAPIDLQWEEIYGRQYDLGTTTLIRKAAQ